MRWSQAIEIRRSNTIVMARNKLPLVLLTSLLGFTGCYLSEESVSDMDENSQYRFSTNGDLLWVNNQTLNTTRPEDLSQISSFDQSYGRTDTVVVAKKRVLQFPNVYGIDSDTIQLLGKVGDYRYSHRPSSLAISDKIALVGKPSDSTIGKFTIDIYDISESGAPSLISVLGFDNISGIELHGDVAYINEGKRITVVDLKVPSQPRKTLSLDVSGARYMMASDSKLLVTLSNSMVQFDIKDPLSPVKLPEFR
jgi:hypothetical protein